MDKRLNILIFIESLGIGGAEKSLVNLLQSIDYTKVNVDLLTLNSGGEFSPYVPAQVSRVSIPEVNGVKKLWSRLCQLRYSLRWRIQRKPRHKAEILWSCMSSAYPPMSKEYDIAIAYQQGLPTYYIATKVKANKKIAWVNVNLHNAGYKKSYNRKYYDKFNHIVAVSKQLYDILSQFQIVNPAKLTTIYDILNPGVIKQMASEYSIDKTRGAITIVTVGRITPQKNQALAVNAAKILKERGYSFCWYLVGDGPDYYIIKYLVESESLDDCIKLTGAQSNPYPYVKACDIYVQTSSFEGFGLTIAEAKILGKPIVSTNFDVVYDQLTNGVNGLIADMTPESVADKIELLISNQLLQNKIADIAGREQNNTNITELAKFTKLLGL